MPAANKATEDVVGVRGETGVSGETGGGVEGGDERNHLTLTGREGGAKSNVASVAVQTTPPATSEPGAIPAVFSLHQNTQSSGSSSPVVSSDGPEEENIEEETIRPLVECLAILKSDVSRINSKLLLSS